MRAARGAGREAARLGLFLSRSPPPGAGGVLLPAVACRLCLLCPPTPAHGKHGRAALLAGAAHPPVLRFVLPFPPQPRPALRRCSRRRRSAAGRALYPQRCAAWWARRPCLCRVTRRAPCCCGTSARPPTWARLARPAASEHTGRAGRGQALAGSLRGSVLGTAGRGGARRWARQGRRAAVGAAALRARASQGLALRACVQPRSQQRVAAGVQASPVYVCSSHFNFVVLPLPRGVPRRPAGRTRP